MFSLINLAFTLVIGIGCGFIAGEIMGSRGDMIRNLILGLLGSFVGTFIASLLGIYTSDLSIGRILIQIVGACLVIFVVKKISK